MTHRTPKRRWLFRISLALGLVVAIAVVGAQLLLHPAWNGLWMQATAPSKQQVALILERNYPSFLAGGDSEFGLWVRRAPFGSLSGDIQQRDDDLVVFDWGEFGNLTDVRWESEDVLSVIALSQTTIESTRLIEGLTVKVSSRWIR